MKQIRLTVAVAWVILALGIHMIFVASLPTGRLNFLFHDATRDYGNGFDFFSIYQAGYNFRHGMSIYFGVREHSYGEAFKVVPYFSGFRYLPIYAYTYGVLLSLLPPWQSYWVWIAIVELMVWFNIVMTWLLAPDLVAFLFAAGMWLAYSPLYLELFMGQQSMVTVSLLTVMSYSLIRNRPQWFSAGYIASVMWKINTLLMTPLLLRMKRFRTLAILSAVIIVTSLPYFLYMPGSWKEFVLYFHVKMIADGPNSLGLWALAAACYKRTGLTPELLLPLLQLVSILIIGVSGVVTFLNRRYQPLRLMTIWLSCFYLTYRYVWEHHYVIILPLLIVLWLQERKKGYALAWLLLALPTPFALFNVPGVSMPQVYWSWREDFLVHAKVLPILGLWLYLCGCEIKRAVSERELLISAKQLAVVRKALLDFDE